MTTILKKILFTFMFVMFGLIGLSPFNLAMAQSGQSPYNDALNKTLSDKSLRSVAMVDVEWGRWANLFNNQIIKLIDYVIYIFIAIWISIAFVWWYKIMASDKEDSTKEWIRLVIFWIVWVIIMVSAKFIANALVWGNNGVISSGFMDDNPNGVQIASDLYEKVLYPFIKLILYLVIGILFFMMAAKVISFVTATDDSTKKKSLGVILWSVIWILVVMWSKQIVEAITWKQDAVLKTTATNIADMWNEILEFERIQLISQIINWVMWLTMLVILVLIIIQWYKMFAKPDDPKNRESLKKTLLYVIIGVLVIWASYVISNVLVINRL